MSENRIIETRGGVDAPLESGADAPTRPPTPLIIGHRGASAYAPENTIISFERALADGADGIEFDVRLARDRVPVVIHDPTLHRTGLRDGEIASLSSTELCEVDMGSWFNQKFPHMACEEYSTSRLSTLSQVFETFKKRGALLYVELKCAETESVALATEVAILIREHDVAEQVVVESFTLSALAAIKRIDASIHTSAVFEPRLLRPILTPRRIVQLAQSCGADGVALYRLFATRRAVSELNRQGMQTVVWTVDDPVWILRARRLDVHALITKNPLRLRAQRDSIAAG
jgi:glycerophosphoryl diester phosphodiesterase